MAATDLPTVPDAGRLINLLPTTLREAALDSPTSRATLQHYYEQVDFLSSWLDDYLKATNRLHAEHQALENIISSLSSVMALPERISETMLDHDYSVLALKKAGEGARDFYMGMVGVVKRLPTLVCDPIRRFQQEELAGFKGMRSRVESSQKNFDELQRKYMALGKNKEPSAIREEAFHLHEARKSYLKAIMDAMTAMPILRGKVDKLFIKIFCGQWNEMRTVQDSNMAVFDKGNPDMQRVKGWIREMEHSETVFQKELITARKQLEEDAELASRPSRELDEYSAYTLAGVSTHAHTTSGTSAALTKSPTKAQFKTGERAGWLFLRTYSAKPTRIVWAKKWAFVRNGVFGWLVRNMNTGGVEESERLGVLLCAVRPAPQEERRFCFELRTTKNVVFLQAETQADLAAWITAFETAKKKAVDDPGSSDGLMSTAAQNSEPAFSISQPPVPEFGTSILASTEPSGYDESSERATSLPIPGSDGNRSSLDTRRDTITDSAARISSKLGLDKKTPSTPQMAGHPGVQAPTGGIASLIAASHGSMPVGPSLPLVFTPMVPRQDAPPRSTFTLSIRDMPPSSLAPSTLANVPAPTSLSKAAVAASGERGLHGKLTGRFGIPNGLLANTWGSSNTSFVNRFDKSELRIVSDQRPTLQPSPMLAPVNPILRSPALLATLSEDPPKPLADLSTSGPLALTRSRTPSPSKRHRNTISFDKNISRIMGKETALPDYPQNYPLQLKTQDAQFRLLFPNVRRDERLALVFRATWNPSGNQDFPGRAYVTTKEMYFYSNHFGLVLTSGVSLSSIDEITAAPGKDCDFLFIHFKATSSDGTTRITVKTFLEPLKLLQRRLNFLVKNAQDEKSQDLEQVIKHLFALEKEVLKRSPSLESWEEVATDSPADNASHPNRARAVTSASVSEFRSPLRIDRSLKEQVVSANTAFKLPAQPVRYSPPGYNHLAHSHEYDISPKALFHVMFGDRSVLWQLLQHERRATNLKQGPWAPAGEGRLVRNFTFDIPSSIDIGSEKGREVSDQQSIDVQQEHLCYVVTDKRTPWHLPYQSSYRLISKIVITHVAKTKCQLAIYTRVDWLNDPQVPFVRRILQKQADADLDLDALNLADIITDQVRKLGSFSRTKKAVQIFGQVGQSSETTKLQIAADALSLELRQQPRPRTLFTLIAQDSFSAAQSVIGEVLQALLDFASWLTRTLSANTVILSLLVTSVLINFFFGSKDGWQWYRERNSAKFLNRIGIRPDTIMSRAIYLADIDVATATHSSEHNIPAAKTSSLCYNTFQEEYGLVNTDTTLLPLSKDATPQQYAAHKLAGVREKLGTYRHDLIVAMRVVNSMEQQFIGGEWEKFVSSESRRCKTMQPLITGTNTTNDLAQNAAELRDWYAEYCGDCIRQYNASTDR